MADNSTKKFKFISPGVFVDEIDQSQLPATPTEVGPVVIGRSRKGPGDKPVLVNSYSDFVQTFGNPVAGNEGGDVWRDGNHTAPTYAAYAAKAWLRNNAPLTFVRTLGTQDDNATDAGKAGWRVPPCKLVEQGGVYALVVWPSSSTYQNSGIGVPVSGAVAAQFYSATGRVLLSGTLAEGSDVTDVRTDLGSTIYEVSTNDNFKLVFTTPTGSYVNEVTVSLDPSSPNFLRKVLNTNPTITNTNITSQSTRNFYQSGSYWLGETFEYQLGLTGSDSIGLLAVPSEDNLVTKYHAAIFPMSVNGTNKTKQQNNFRGAAKRASTGWFISQDLSNNTGAYAARTQQQLFRLEALTAGEWAQREIKISISNIKAPVGDYQKYGTFSVLVRSLTDTDARPLIIERFDELNINPASENYIAKRIGDRYQVYDQSSQSNVEYGQFDNSSNYIRVVMNDDVATGGTETRWLPFGVFGPIKYRDVGLVSGSGGFSSLVTDATPRSGSVGLVRTMIDGGDRGDWGTAGHQVDSDGIVSLTAMGKFTAKQCFSGSIQFPSVPTRGGNLWGSPRSLRNCYWGAWSGQSSTNTFFNPSIHDHLRARSFDYDPGVSSTDIDVSGLTSAYAASQPYVFSWVFSLDNISGSVSENYRYSNDYRSAGTSVTAAGASYKAALTAGLDRFTTMLAGGTDGYDIQERDPFRNSEFSAATDEKSSSKLYSLRKSINIVSDPDSVQMNAVTMPGIINATVTNYLLDTAEDRADTLALIDVPYAYTPDTEALGSAEARNAANKPSAAALNLEGRSINNSYGATYYPWVRILDTNTNQSLWAPPSVAALGVLSTTDRNQAPWFAPAGFTRGGLSEGAAGVPVLDVSRRLTSDDRDTLYEANINPIAKFPAEGIVIFGQKTLQQTASALDRINVRRLMIYLKREISFIASRLLFAPNAQATWDRFLGQANPLLRDVKSEFGIDDFRLILDESTTTPDLVDRNIIYAKLYVKPTRSVEFFAIDFIITNSGASFED
jgi:hypothetical protein